MRKLTYLAVLEPASEGYGVFFPDLPGCISFGKDIEAAQQMGRKALELQIYSMEKDGDQIPAPSKSLSKEDAECGIVTAITILPDLVKNEMENSADSDPFYSEVNQSRLRKSIDLLDNEKLTVKPMDELENMARLFVLADTMKTVFPVIFTQTKDMVLVEVPDLEILTEGADMADAIDMARDAIGLKGICIQDDAGEIPTPSKLSQIDSSKGTFANEGEVIMSLVDIDFSDYRRRLDNKKR